MIPSAKTATKTAIATIFLCGEVMLTEGTAVKAEYQAVDISTAPRRLSLRFQARSAERSDCSRSGYE
jgi:hypothetical protein